MSFDSRGKPPSMQSLTSEAEDDFGSECSSVFCDIEQAAPHVPWMAQAGKNICQAGCGFRDQSGAHSAGPVSRAHACVRRVRPTWPARFHCWYRPHPISSLGVLKRPGVSPAEVARRAGHSILVLFRFYAKAIHRTQQRSNQQIEQALDAADEE